MVAQSILNKQEAIMTAPETPARIRGADGG